MSATFFIQRLQTFFSFLDVFLRLLTFFISISTFITSVLMNEYGTTLPACGKIREVGDNV